MIHNHRGRIFSSNNNFHKNKSKNVRIYLCKMLLENKRLKITLNKYRIIFS